MRIIAGTHKSRILKTLEGMNTRPMMDRMKESVFNTIGPYFDDIETLDLFGGSGALTLESISRGAKNSVIVELNHQAYKVIKSNVEMLKEEDKVQILNVDYKIALKRLISEERSFDLIFLDPPYRLNIVGELVNTIVENNIIKPDGYIICQYVRGNYKPVEIDGFEIKKNYTYSSSEVTIYHRVANID